MITRLTRSEFRTGGVAMLIAGLGLLLAACGGAASADPVSVGDCQLPSGTTVLAVGGRANMPAVSLEALDRYVAPSIDHGSKVTVIDTGGAPSAKGSIDFGSDAANSEAQNAELAADAQDLRALIERTEARSEEANPLKALELAARQIQSGGGGGTIVLVDSGLQTTGVLDYTTGLLNADPSDIAKSLDDRHELPDLHNISVVLLGIGDTASPQDPLDTAQQSLLREQWTSIVSKAGAACVYADPAPLSEPALTGVPDVSLVAVPEAKAITPANVVVLDSGTVPFVSDSAELRDPAAAKSTLTDIADSLTSSGAKVELTGTTATDGTEEGRQKLSLARAETVRGILVDLGVPEANITVKGVGIHNPEHVNDLDANGNLIPAAAAKNRTVILKVQN